MPLLGKDHLARGSGDVQLFNKVAYTGANFSVQYTTYRLLFTDFGPWCASVVAQKLGLDTSAALLDMPIGEARPLQAYLLLGGIALYSAKVLFWEWKFSHSNTLSIGAIVLVGFWYYYALIFSIMLSTYLVNRMPTTVEIAISVIVEPISLMHELLVDYELTEFKRTKAQGELLDYGYHSACRHPNYFFNFFPLAAVGLMSGSPAVGLAWFCIQVFWAYNQSGPTLEKYMKDNYGRSWREYCKRVPFVLPKPYRFAQMLAFRYVGDKKQKIQATGKMSMIGLDKSMLKSLQKEAAESMETIAED